MHKSDKLYLSRFELDPDLFGGIDEIEYNYFNDDSYPDEFSEEDESLWVDNTWDEYL